jgi:GNAT superfamily N-acetyltransferase
MSSHEPGSTGAPPVTIQYASARVRDVPGMVRFYMGLSESARSMYHPFPWNRAALYAIYFILAFWQSYFLWLMRRRPSLIRLISVAHVAGTRTVVGTCTLRGEMMPDLGWCVRAGLATSDGYRGHKIGVKTLRKAVVVADQLGIRYQIGSAFVSNKPILALQTALGARIFPIDKRDPYRPEEPRVGTVLEIPAFLQKTADLAGT